MFVHFGLYAMYGRNEWVWTLENIPRDEYVARANEFQPKPGCPREWAKLAKEAGMKYMVTPLKSACLLPDRTPLAFQQKDQRILFTDLPKECPDQIANRAVIELEFDEPPVHKGCSKQPALHGGKEH